jgi:AmiR/NasT family two-component response regulator
MTAYSDDKILEHTKKTKAYGYIIKRITAGKIQKIIKTAIKKHQQEKKIKHHPEYNTSKYIKTYPN